MQNQFVTVNGLTIRYQQLGDQGSPVILLHGLNAALDNWQANIGALSQQHRVFALDLPGFGLSDKPKIRYDLPLYVNTLMAFMDHFQLHKVTLVGNSLGGGLALMMAIHHPERIQKLVLCSSAGFSRHLPASFRFLTIRFLNRWLLKPSLNKSRFSLKSISVQQDFITEAFVKRMYQYNSSPGATHALLNLLQNFASFTGVKKRFIDLILKNLPNLRLPILIIWGKDDPLLSLEHAKPAIATLPNHQLLVFDECGHMPQIEKPEAFNQAVLEFLAKN